MQLSGTLETMSLADLLQWCASNGKTGTLRLRRDPFVKNIFFKRGGLYSSTSNSPRETLVQFLLRSGKVTEEQLSEAFAVQERSNEPLGQILIGEGVITEVDLAELLRLKTVETIYDCFSWTEGQFSFLGRGLPETIAVPTPIEIPALVLEGTRRTDEWNRIRAVFRSRFTTFEKNRTSAVPTESTPDDEAILRLVEQGRNLAEIALALNALEYDAACRLFDLYQRDLIQVDQIPEGVSYDQEVEELQSHVREGASRFNEGRYPEALASFERALRIDPNHKYARHFVRKIEMIPSEQRHASRIPLESVPTLRVAPKHLSDMALDPQEGFVVSRINGEWDVGSILKLCPFRPEEVLLIVRRLVDDEVIQLREPARPVRCRRQGET